MRRHEFDHVISAAAEVCEEREIVVIGSQAILGSVEEPPPSMLVSMEADVYPLGNPGKAIEIEGALGEGSMFQGTYGYYAHGRRTGDGRGTGGLAGALGQDRNPTPRRAPRGRDRVLSGGP